jgi:hypothetical protein
VATLSELDDFEARAQEHGAILAYKDDAESEMMEIIIVYFSVEPDDNVLGLKFATQSGDEILAVLMKRDQFLGRLEQRL